MSNNLFIVDSFTQQAFKGNPAAVHLVNHSLPADQMQAIAREMNLSETAFVSPSPSTDEFAIRYFSPLMEIPLCGHATLAAACVMFGNQHSGPIHFHTGENRELIVKQVGDLIEMQFPIYGLEPATASGQMLSALGIQAVEYAGFNPETNILMLEIEDVNELIHLKPDYQSLVSSHDSIHGVVVTARADDDHDFYSRFFWPWSGGEEDPVTGATHTFLANYWSKKIGKTKLNSFQASARTGSMQLEIASESELLIRGYAVIVVEGNLRV